MRLILTIALLTSAANAAAGTLELELKLSAEPPLLAIGDHHRVVLPGYRPSAPPGQTALPARVVRLALPGDCLLSSLRFEVVDLAPVVEMALAGRRLDMGPPVRELRGGRTIPPAAFSRLPAGTIHQTGLGTLGDVIIAEGILEGKDLEGRLETGWGRDGTLRVGLKGKDGPFQLDFAIDTDIALALSELNRFIKSASLRSELKRIQGLQGKATGRLTLGETLSSMKTRVEVSRFDLSARYDRIPFPVKTSISNLNKQLCFRNRRRGANSRGFFFVILEFLYKNHAVGNSTFE